MILKRSILCFDTESTSILEWTPLCFITVASEWARWRLKSPASRLLIQAFIEAQIKESSASLAFVRGIHRWPVNSPHKRPVTRKTLPFDDVIMCCQNKLIRHVNHLHALHVFCDNEAARKCLSMGDASRMCDITVSELWWNWLWFLGPHFY